MKTYKSHENESIYLVLVKVLESQLVVIGHSINLIAFFIKFFSEKLSIMVKNKLKYIYQ